MRFLIVGVGQQGDIEPCLGLAERLQNQGHTIHCVFPEQYRQHAVYSGFKFTNLDVHYLNALETDEGKLISGGMESFGRVMNAHYKLYKAAKEAQYRLIRLTKVAIDDFNPDKIIYSGKAIYPIVWSIDNPDNAIFISAVPSIVRRIRGYPHAHSKYNLGWPLNDLISIILTIIWYRTIVSCMKHAYHKSTITYSEVRKAVRQNKTIYAISPTLFKRPKYWPAHVKVLGYHMRDNIKGWFPDLETKAFMAYHDKILFITFGQMLNTKAVKLSEMIVSVTEKLKIPTIIKTNSIYF